VHFASALAQISADGELDVQLTSVPSTCDKAATGAYYTVEFHAPAGPGKKFFAGTTFVPGLASIRRKGGPSMRDEFALRGGKRAVRFDAFKPTVGGLIHGTLSFDARSSKIQTRNAHGDEATYAYVGAGTFDATVCSIDGAFEKMAPPADAPSTPLVASIGGDPFTAKSAVTYLILTDGERPQLSDVELYADPGVTCDNRRQHDASTLKLSVDVDSPGSDTVGVTYVVPFTSREKTTRKPGGGFSTSSESLRGTGFIVFDSVDASEGGHVKARVSVESAPGVDGDTKGFVRGAIDAVTCTIKM